MEDAEEGMMLWLSLFYGEFTNSMEVSVILEAFIMCLLLNGQLLNLFNFLNRTSTRTYKTKSSKNENSLIIMWSS